MKANPSVWVTGHYIYPDHDELQLEAQLTGCAPKTMEYLESKDKLKKMLKKNRGITSNKKAILDCVEFAKYLNKKRLRAIMLNGRVYLYNRKTGIFDKPSREFVLKLMKKVLEECEIRVWSTAVESQYYQAFVHEIPFFRGIQPYAGRIVFQNGTLDVKDMILARHSYKDYALSGLPYAYNPDAECPVFLDTLSDIFNHDVEVIQSFQEMMGYLLYYGNHYPIQKFFIFYGTGSNGKGVLVRVIRNMLGDNNCSATFLDDLQERFGKQNLYDKYVNISPEHEQKKLFNTAVIKSVTGGDLVEIEEKYEKAFAMPIYTKFIVCCNQPIKTDDSSRGYFRRLHIFVFPNHYIELKACEERVQGVRYMDKQLDIKLEAETQGICNWALKGLKRLIDNNWEMSPCKAIDELQEKYYLEANPVENFFECCIRKGDSSCEIKTSALFSCYQQWADRNDINQGIYNTHKNFRRKAEECLVKMGRSSNTRRVDGYEYYQGICINS